MRRTASIVIVLLGLPIAVRAQSTVLDCGKKSLTEEVRSASPKDQTVVFTGICAGPIVIARDGITLKGVGAAIIDGGGTDNAVVIAGSSRVSLVDVEIRNGTNGIVARDGSHISLNGVSLRGNGSAGIRLLNSSSAVLSDVISQANLVGLLVDNGAAITVTGSTLTLNTSVDIQLTFASRADIRTTTLGTWTCDGTVLVRGSSGVTCPN